MLKYILRFAMIDGRLVSHLLYAEHGKRQQTKDLPSKTPGNGVQREGATSPSVFKLLYAPTKYELHVKTGL